MNNLTNDPFNLDSKEISQFKIDSRKIVSGDVFIAGNNKAPIIKEAIDNGADIIITDLDFTSEQAKIHSFYDKPNYDALDFLGEHLATRYKHELKDLQLIGVTGTNGKTSTCSLVKKILWELGFNVTTIGTNGVQINDGELIYNSYTTPHIIELYKIFLDSVAANSDTIVMEVSSHAIAQKRVAGLKYDVLAFTNLTQEHLDYHKDIDDYFNVKKSFFEKNAKPNARCVINTDDK